MSPGKFVNHSFKHSWRALKFIYRTHCTIPPVSPNNPQYLSSLPELFAFFTFTDIHSVTEQISGAKHPVQGPSSDPGNVTVSTHSNLLSGKLPYGGLRDLLCLQFPPCQQGPLQRSYSIASVCYYREAPFQLRSLYRSPQPHLKSYLKLISCTWKIKSQAIAVRRVQLSRTPKSK